MVTVIVLIAIARVMRLIQYPHCFVRHVNNPGVSTYHVFFELFLTHSHCCREHQPSTTGSCPTHNTYDQS